MNRTAEQLGTGAIWPPEEGQMIEFKSLSGFSTATVKDVQWGLVWRDFILDDGRVIPEHKVLGCPAPPVWRNADEVSQDEREAAEERLVSMADAGMDPRDREHAFWAELNQYLAYTYLRFKKSGSKPPELE